MSAFNIDTDRISDYSVFNKPPYLFEQFVGTDVEKLCKICDKQFQDLEDALVFMLASGAITGVCYGGANLDIIGVLVGVPRNGMEDNPYMAMVMWKISINTCAGSPEEVIKAVQLLTQSTSCQYIPHPPGKVEIVANALYDLSIITLMNDIMPAGVSLYFGGNYWVSEDAKNFVTQTGDKFRLRIKYRGGS